VSERLRILLDAAPLGSGVEPGPGRAGIFRASEGFVMEALRRPDLDIEVAALDHYLAEVLLLRYDRQSGGVLGARRRDVWQHPTLSHDETAAAIDRIVALGETSAAARRPMAELALTNRLAHAVRPETTYDVYHSLRGELAAPARVSARARVLTMYDVIPLQFPEWFEDGAAARMRATLATVRPDRDWIVCNSSRVRLDISERLTFDPARIVVIPLAADRRVFHPVDDREVIADVRRRYGLGDKPYVMSVCTIEPRKNLAHLIRSVASLFDEPAHRDLQLVLVGAMGWKTSAAVEAYETSPVRDRIHLTGFVPDPDLAPLYAGAEAFVYPSRYEGFGLPVLEAMQCGVPVVTTTGGALPEVAGPAALIVDPDDRDALVNAITRARGSRELAADGLRRASAFTWAHTLDLTVAAYRAMLADC
jgi:glycosyltransferase involved in cell wall biosynthesis